MMININTMFLYGPDDRTKLIISFALILILKQEKQINPY